MYTYIYSFNAANLMNLDPGKGKEGRIVVVMGAMPGTVHPPDLAALD